MAYVLAPGGAYLLDTNSKLNLEHRYHRFLRINRAAAKSGEYGVMEDCYILSKESKSVMKKERREREKKTTPKNLRSYCSNEKRLPLSPLSKF